MFAFLNIDKPLGLTSHDVVARVRRLLRERGMKDVKVGHAGTLDPLATGVLVLCLGAATRLSEYVMNHDKTYQAAIVLGIETATYDAEGQVSATANASYVTRAQVERALTENTGAIAQVPPMYSAIKQGGKKLYDLARAGQVVERAPRHVTIHSIILERYLIDEPQHPVVECVVRCSAGTYIRSLAHDLGAMLGVGAHLTRLRRTASGTFLAEDAVTLERLAAAEDWTPLLTEPLDALADMPRVELDDDDWGNIRNGRPIAGTAADGTHAVAVAGVQLRAVLRAEAGQWHPHKVFLSADPADADRP